jgi:ribosome-associated toxin RatA of RatAB toxin-antitoxin module
MILKNSYSVNICKPIEMVYKIAEQYPAFVKHYTVKSNDENTETLISVTVGYEVMGIAFKWRGLGKKVKNKSILYTQTDGLLKGLTAHWIFNKSGNETSIVEINTTYHTSVFLKWFFERQVKATIRNILNDLKSACEN